AELGYCDALLARELAGLSSFPQYDRLDGRDLCRHAGKAKPTSKKLRPKDRPLENDFVSDEEFNELLHVWFGNLARVLLPGRAFYLWAASRTSAITRRP